MTKLIQHDKSHVVWVLPCHHITHGCMAKPMYVMHWHIHGFFHAQTKYYSAFGNLTLIVMWSCLTMSINENFISHLHHNHRFLWTVVTAVYWGAWHYISLFHPRQSSVFVELLSANSFVVSENPCSRRKLPYDLLENRQKNVKACSKCSLIERLCAKRPFSHALVSLFVLTCWGPGLDSTSPQSISRRGNWCWFSAHDLKSKFSIN